MLRRTLLAIALTVFDLPASAGAAVIQDFSAFTSATNGIALGPDGNYWVAEENSTTVARMTPAGAIVGRVERGHRCDLGGCGPGRNRVGVGHRVRTSSRASTVATLGGHSRSAMSAGLPPGRDRRRRQRAHVLLPARDATESPDRRSGRSPRTAPDWSGRTRTVTSTTSPLANGKLFAPHVRRRRGAPLQARARRAETTVGVVGGPDGITADGAGQHLGVAEPARAASRASRRARTAATRRRSRPSAAR